jgi:HK97 family phage prohead protease
VPIPIPTKFETRDAYAVGDDGDVVLRPPSVRLATEDVGPGYDGYPVRWMVVDSYGTAFQRGAVKKSIRERQHEIPVLWQHDPVTPIGRHIEMREDKDGLFVRTVISDTAAGRDAMTLLRDGVPLGLSFGFHTVNERKADDNDQLDFSVAPAWAKRLPREEIRIITEVAYWEDSPVTFASNPKAKPEDVRSVAHDHVLASLMNAIRAGTLTPEQADLCTQIVAADSERAGAGPGHSTPDEARHAEPIDVIAMTDFLLRKRLSLSGVLNANLS